MWGVAPIASATIVLVGLGETAELVREPAVGAMVMAIVGADVWPQAAKANRSRPARPSKATTAARLIDPDRGVHPEIGKRAIGSAQPGKPPSLGTAGAFQAISKQDGRAYGPVTFTSVTWFAPAPSHFSVVVTSLTLEMSLQLDAVGWPSA